METIGVANLSLELINGVKGECTLCPSNLIVEDETYVFSDDDGPIAAYHKNCFWHMAVVMREHFERFGLPQFEEIN